MSTPSLTSALVAELLNRPVSDEVREAAALHFTDWLGTVVAATKTDVGNIIHRFASEREEGPHRAIGSGRRGADVAAFVNGALGIVLELDAVHRASRLHPGDPVIPAALVAAERVGADGKALLDAIVLGYEVMIRVGESVGPGHYATWHPTGTCGPFGAAFACGVLFGLNHEQLVSALGNAGTQAGGLWQARAEGAMSKPIHTGRAAQAGLVGAELASLGMSGPAAILEGPMGLFAASCPDPDPAAILRSSAGWKLEEVSFKPWAACRHAHPAIDAALEIGHMTPSLVRNIEVRTYPDALAFTDNQHPSTVDEARFSLQHVVGVALLRGEPGLQDFEAEARGDLLIRQLRDITSVAAAEPYTGDYPLHWGAEVTVLTKDDQHTAVRRDAKGDPELPMSADEIVSKAHQLLLGGDIDEPDHLVWSARNLAGSQTLAEVLDPLP